MNSAVSPSAPTPLPAELLRPSPSPGKPNAAQTVTFICLSVAVFLVCCIALALGVWLIWIKSKREYEAALRRHVQSQNRGNEGEPPAKQQVRLPVVVVQPDDEVQYGRAESRFFPKKPPQLTDNKADGSELPDTPPKGAYYIQGAPGYFEVDLEVSKPSKSSACSPQTSTSKILASPRSFICAAMTRLSSKSQTRPACNQEVEPRDLEDSAHDGKDCNIQPE